MLVAGQAASQVPGGPPDNLPAATDPGSPDPAAAEKKRILDMDIEQLSKAEVKTSAPAADVEVTAVAKQESTVGRSPAAVFVITSEMIRRSGATNIPDLLRMVPGLEVARLDASTW